MLTHADGGQGRRSSLSISAAPRLAASPNLAQQTDTFGRLLTPPGALQMKRFDLDNRLNRRVSVGGPHLANSSVLTHSRAAIRIDNRFGARPAAPSPLALNDRRRQRSCDLIGCLPPRSPFMAHCARLMLTLQYF